MNTLTRFPKFDPFFELNTLRRQMERFYNPFLEREMESTTAEWAPYSDIMETKDALIVYADLPGLTQNDIKVELENGVLTIHGERTFWKTTKDDQYHRVERAYGKFFRSFALPPNVLPEKIVAKYEQGVLAVTIPKKEEAKAKLIKIAA